MLMLMLNAEDERSIKAIAGAHYEMLRFIIMIMIPAAAAAEDADHEQETRRIRLAMMARSAVAVEDAGAGDWGRGVNEKQAAVGISSRPI